FACAWSRDPPGLGKPGGRDARIRGRGIAVPGASDRRGDPPPPGRGGFRRGCAPAPAPLLRARGGGVETERERQDGAPPLAGESARTPPGGDPAPGRAQRERRVDRVADPPLASRGAPVPPRALRTPPEPATVRRAGGASPGDAAPSRS